MKIKKTNKHNNKMLYKDNKNKLLKKMIINKKLMINHNNTIYLVTLKIN